jgi:c-di-AMP phosphodiesterase-like protein
MKKSKKIPFTPIFIAGLVLILISNTVDEYLKIKWIYYLMVGSGALLLAVEILRNFKEMDKNYLAELDKAKHKNKHDAENK